MCPTWLDSMLESLITDIFEPRRQPEVECSLLWFAFVSWEALVLALQLDGADKKSIICAKEENIRLLVAVRGSETSTCA